MSTQQSLANDMADIICDRNEALEDRYLEVAEAVGDALEADWDIVFGPWLDSVQDRIEARLGASS